MPLDQSPIGHLAAQLMEELERATDDNGSIGAVCLIVEVNTPDGTSRMHIKFNDARNHIQLGMLELGRLAVERQLGASE